MRSNCVWVAVIFCLVGAFGLPHVLGAPIWCSQFYDPYYPLDPYNVSSLPHIPIPPMPTPPMLRLLFTVQPYTYESSGGFLVTVNQTQAKQSFVRFDVSVSNTGQKIASNVTVPTGENNYLVPFAFSYVPMNAFTNLTCTISVYNQFNYGPSPNASAVIETQNITIQRFQYKPYEVKIDYRSMGLTVQQGLPLMPMGFYYIWNAKCADIIVEEVPNGFNAPLPYRPTIPISKSYMEMLEIVGKMGSRLHFDMYGLGEEPSSPNKTQLVKETIIQLMDQPGLLAYYIADEPDGEGFGLDPAILREVYLQIKQIDPWHPVTLVLNCVHSAPRYVGCADIIMSDPYCIDVAQPVGCNECAGSVTDVPFRADTVRQEIDYAKPYWLVLQAFTGGEHWPRLPSWQEERAMTYLGLIHGSRSFLYFLEGLPTARSLWAECRRLALELANLTPAVLSVDSAELFVAVTAQPSRQLNATAFVEQQRGVLTVVVANAWNSPVPFTLTISNLTLWSALHPQPEPEQHQHTDSPSSSSSSLSAVVAAAEELEVFHLLQGQTLRVQVLFENREMNVTNGVISDYLDGYGTRAYRIFLNPQQQQQQSPIQPGNMILNPSFEQQHNVEVVDAYTIESLNGQDYLNVGLIDTRVSQWGYSSLRLNVAAPSLTVKPYPVVIPANQTFTLQVSVLSWNVQGNSANVQLGGCGSSTTVNVPPTVAVGSVGWSNSQAWTVVKVPVRVTEVERCQFSLTVHSEGTVWLDNFQLYSN